MRRGFTLLEVLVATTIMGIAVVSLLAGLSTSLRNAARLTAYDRAVMLARTQMDQLSTDRRIPTGAELHGAFDVNTGWDARFTPFEMPPNAPPGAPMLERIELQVWWVAPSGERRTFPLESYRRSIVPIPLAQ